MSEKIIRVNVADAAEEYTCKFGANKNLYRTIPSFQDGLKPGKRRIFYSFWETNGKPTNVKKETLNRLKFYKVQNVAAHAMIYHPHGDDSNTDIIANEGQHWNNNVCTIVPQGNYGSVRGDPHAAARYIECKMSEYLIDCFFDDFDKYCVPMKPSYDGERVEPEFLPAKYPHALFNPQLSGIGYGIASNIISFNITEVLRATIKLIKHPNANIMLIPDIPTKADIVDTGDFENINNTGEGKIVMRASSEIDHAKNIIKITSVPLQTSTKIIISKIIEKKKKGEFQDIIDIKDYTKHGETNIEIYLKSDANPDKVLKKLYNGRVDLKTTASFSLKLIDDYKENQYSIKSFLQEWIEYRRDIVRSMFTNSLMQSMEKQHMNDVLLFVFSKDNAETTLKICKSSSSRRDTIENLVKKYNITSLQAATIADMHLYNFNKDSYKKYKDEKTALTEEINRITKILDDEKLIDEFIIDQLETGIKKYGHPRHSKIVKDDKEIDEDSIPDTEHIIAISERGLIKKVQIFGDDTPVGIVGKNGENYTVLTANNRQDILIIDSEGMVIRIPVSSLPNMNHDEIGVELSRYFKCNGKIIGIMSLPDKRMLKEKNNNACITLITKMGYAKRVKLSDFKGISEPKKSILLSDGDELVAARFTLNNTASDIIIYTNDGYGIRIPVVDINIFKKEARGSKVINMGEGQHVQNANIIINDIKHLFYITTSGRAKITQAKYFPTMKRGDEPLQLITLSGTDRLLYIEGVCNRRGAICRVYFKNKEPKDLKLADVELTTRKAEGKKYIKVPRGESIVSVKMFV